MASVHTSLFVLSVTLFSVLPAHADSWTLTQTVAVSSDVVLSQSGSNGAIEGVNVIKLNNTNGIAVDVSQSMTTGANDLTLTQDATSSSYQAVNYLSAAHINVAEQIVTNVDHVLLEQQNGGNDNVQALNIAIAKGAGTQIDALTQTVSANSFSFGTSGSGNIQAGNYIQADAVSTTAGDVVQNFNVSGTVSYALAGTDNLQAGNVLIKNTGSFTGSVIQNFSAGNVVVSFYEQDANNSIKAANYFAQKL